MNRSSRIWVSMSLMLVLFAASNAWAQDKAAEKSSPSTAALRAAMETASAKFAAGLKAGDANAVSLLYTDDAVVMAPNAPAAKGRKAIAEMFGQWLSAVAINDFKITTGEVFPAGEYAVETGTYTVSQTPKAGGGPISETGKFVALWKRDSDGVWKLHRDAWNSDAPPPGAK